jgi:type I restriction enzyme S subunit
MLKADYPSEWSRQLLEDVAEVRTGLAKGKKNIIDPVTLPYIRVANVQDGHLDLREIKRIQVARAEVKRYSLQEGDILLTEGGDFDKLGRGTMWRNEIPECLHQNHIFVVRADRGRILPDYLVWLTNSPHGREYFRRCSKQSTNLASINTRQLKRYPVVLPGHDEQLRIAKVLWCSDKGLGVAKQLLKAHRKLKRGLLQKLLTGEQRFPEFRDQPLVEYRLGDLAERVTRTNSGGSMHALTISGRTGFVDQRKYFSKMIAGASIGDSYLIKRGEFAYNRSLMKGYPFGATKRLNEFDEGVVSKLYIVFAVSNHSALNSDFLVHLFESGMLNRQLCRIANIGSRAHGLLNVVTSDFFGMSLRLPSLPEQKRIAELLDSVDREIKLLSDLHKALQEQKKGLMQQLLTGNVRVPESILESQEVH